MSTGRGAVRTKGGGLYERREGGQRATHMFQAPLCTTTPEETITAVPPCPTKPQKCKLRPAFQARTRGAGSNGGAVYRANDRCHSQALKCTPEVGVMIASLWHRGIRGYRPPHCNSYGKDPN